MTSTRRQKTLPRGENPGSDGAREADLQRLLHELQVHQIELEAQNEELQAAQLALEASQARYFDLFDLAPMGYLALDDAGLIVDANLAAATLLGVDRTALIRQPLARFVVDPDRLAYRRCQQHVLATGAPQSCELKMRRVNAEPFWARLDATPVCSSDGRPACRVVMCDVTERKRLERASQDAANFLECVLDSIGDPVFVKDRDHVFVLVNEALCRLTGHERGEMLGRTDHALFQKEHADEFVRVDDLVLDTGVANTNEELISDARGGERVVVTKKARYTDRDGHRFVVGVVRDITERRQSEQRIQDFSRMLLTVREDERKRLATALHHDLGSLAIGVSSRLDAAKDEIVAGRPLAAVPYLDGCLGLLQDSVARLKSIAVDLRPPDLELLGLAMALRQRCARVREEAGLPIRFVDGTGGLAIDESTAIVLYRVGQEALTNAVRHARASHVSVRLSASGGLVRLSIRDDGCGFDVRPGRELSPSAMGLTSMSEMARSVGGTAEILSRPGEGTRVVVTLPLARRDA